MVSSAYAAALKMLARRELSESQVRGRLARRGHEPVEVDEAIARLVGERAVDDHRVATAIVRTQVARRRGRIRVERELERAGIAPAVARAAIDAEYEGSDPDALVEEALVRRLRGQPIADDSQFRRLYRYLLAQGFEADRAFAALERRRRSPRD
jgi:regulatory protein